ncbi:hypothetical protein [Flavobacterium anhuiense]|uniref:hypothetical protein n=1 Tax=Flavobacterium anhuiense TaxID=459526 RepID=UPI003D96ADAE
MRKYNLISQRFDALYNDIPFLEVNYKTDNQYNVFVEILDIDYISSFFKDFETANLYGIYIENEGDNSSFSNLKVISKQSAYAKNIILVKPNIDFFRNIEYNNRDKIAKPFFFRSYNLDESIMRKIINDSLCEKLIMKDNFRKNIIKVDALKLLNHIEIETVINFYVNRTEAHLEDVLKLRNGILDVEAEYISKVEISLGNSY